MGLSLIVVIGSGSMDESRSSATLERAEQALLSFDSQSGAVAMGDARSALTDLGDGRDGRFAVAKNAGSIRITHERTEDDGDGQEIYSATLGALRYEHDGTTIGYQGGGVWRAQGDGSVMVSPPPITYQDETLVMPLVRVTGDGAVTGHTSSVAEVGRDPVTIYPNTSRAYADGSAYRNPVQQGLVTVTVTSEFYLGWAEYFRTRSDGSLTVDHGEQSVTLELTAGGTMGEFDMPNEGNPVKIRGLSDDHGVRNFTVVLAPDGSDEANFDNLQWSMYVDNGARERMELHLRDSERLPKARACEDIVVSLSLYYREANGGPYHGWVDDNAFRTECVDRNGDGEADETRLVANLTGDSEMTMGKLTRSDLTHFKTSKATLEDPLTIEGHGGWEPATFESDDSTTMRRLTRHYLSSLGSDYELFVDDKNSDTVEEDDSWGRLTYDGEGRVTFMHISDRDLRVTLRG
jgi:hypothetical protein